jgi:hypothetical protein
LEGPKSASSSSSGDQDGAESVHREDMGNIGNLERLSEGERDARIGLERERERERSQRESQIDENQDR